ncbi:MAG TPA: hypothetical protein VF100_02980 [Thermoanaerobaculia bacterium]
MRPTSEEELLRHAVARLRAGVLAVVFALVGGTGLFLATAWLLLRGGEPVGPHLALLGHYFPGYRVTWPGAFLGFAYAAAAGAVVGAAVGWIYNRMVLWLEGRPEARHPAARD